MKRTVYKIQTIIITFALSIMLFPFVSVSTNAVAAGVGPRYEELIGKRDFKWPVPGWYGLSSCFMDGRDHYAIDIPANEKTTVVAAYDGDVVDVRVNGVDDGGYGNTVIIEHEYVKANGDSVLLYTQYGHLNSVSVKEGQSVSAGTKIGGVGGSGWGNSNYYANHLDFQILTANKWGERSKYSIDPYINELMELPSNIYCASTNDCCGVGPTGCCCFYYLQEVKSIYAIPQKKDYARECQYYPSHVNVTVSQDTWIREFPCSEETAIENGYEINESTYRIRDAKIGETYEAIGLYLNTEENYWYKVKCKDKNGNDTEGYLYSGRTKTPKSKDLIWKVEDNIIDPVYPVTVNAGKSFSIKGTVSSGYMKLLQVTGSISKDGTVRYTHTADATGSTYSLQGSAIDNALLFGQLEAGQYTYSIDASYHNYHAINGTTLASPEFGEFRLLSKTFNVVDTSEPIQSYVDKCDFYHSYLTVKLKASTNLRAQPCMTSTDASGIVVTTLNSGTKLTVTGLYKNTANEYWYRTTYDGKTCYFVARNAEIVEFLSSATISGASMPDKLSVGQSFALKGTISSEYTYLKHVGAKVVSGTENILWASAVADGKPYNLAGSSIDTNMPFNTLAADHYGMVVYVEEYNYYSTDGKTKEVVSLWPEVYRNAFTVGKPGNTTPGKPTLTGMKAQYEIGEDVVFNWGTTAHTTHYSLYIDKKNTSGTYERVINGHYVAPGVSYTLEKGEYQAFLQAVNSRESTDDGSAWDYTSSSTVKFTVGDIVYTGTCGDKATWTLNETTGVLTISGSGAMYDFASKSPWYSYRSLIKKVTVEDTVTTIGDRSFSNCVNLKEVTLGTGIVSIGNAAFSGCSSLAGTVELPASLTTLKSEIFNKSAITGVTLKNKVSFISPHAFYGSNSLSKITVSSDNASYSSSSGVLFNEEKTTLICYPPAKTSSTYMVPDGVKAITTAAFQDSLVTKIVLPDTVTEVSATAFCNCKKLTSISYHGTRSDLDLDNLAVDNVTIHYLHEVALASVARNSATCTKAGNIYHWYCLDCDRYFLKQDGTFELSKMEITIPVVDHKWDNGTVTKVPTATTTGVNTHTCSLCGTTKTEKIPVLSDITKIEMLELEGDTVAAKVYCAPKDEASAILAFYNQDGQMLFAKSQKLVVGDNTIEYDSAFGIEFYDIVLFVYDEFNEPLCEKAMSGVTVNKEGFRSELTDALGKLGVSTADIALDMFADGDRISNECTEAVLNMLKLGIMTGEGKTFDPNIVVSRAELAKMLYITLNGGVDDGAVAYAKKALFSDVSEDAWYAGYANYCADQKLISTGDGYFRAGDPATVLEVAKALLCVEGYSSDVCGYTSNKWHLNVEDAAEKTGLFNGFNYSVYGSIPRQWCAVLFNNVLKTNVCFSHSFSGGICKKCAYEWPHTEISISPKTYQIVDEASAWTRPYENNSQERYNIPVHSNITVIAYVKNQAGNTWYKMANGLWVYGGNLGKAGVCTSHSFSGGICKNCGYEWPYKITTLTPYTAKVIDEAGAWTRPYENHSFNMRDLPLNTIVTITAATKNQAGNTWYKMVDGLWVYGGNVENADVCTKHTYSGGFCSVCKYEWPYETTATVPTVYKVIDQAGAWTRPYSSNSVEVYQLPIGSSVTVVGVAENQAGNSWYKMDTGLWVYSGNLGK